MKYSRFWTASLMVVFATISLTTVSTVNAQEPEIPWTSWTSMNPDSFLIDIGEMDNRCHEGTAHSSATAEECDEAKAMLQANQCSYLPIPDGIRYEFLIGLKAGKPHVYQHKEKRLGASRMAYSCTVSTGRVIDWYAGEDGVSCGNVAARPLTKVALAAEETPSQVVEERVCETIPISIAGHNYSWSTKSQLLNNCGCTWLFTGGTDTEYVVPSGTAGFESCKTITRKEVQK